jgi:hypothetical protein
MAFQNSDVCATCGETYAEHYGMYCPRMKGQFVAAALLQDWSCYTISLSGSHHRRILTAGSLEEARARYLKAGNNQFVTAEPFRDYPVPAGITGDQIRERIAHLILAGQEPIGKPRKPVPQVVAEVHNSQPIDAAKCWAAVVAACGGQS